ncbi:uncharacterized protein LOC127717469 [Mytilus californianus]|uniref:uncharacterized protein LOC127717469 n=1 Tax=Mytilus californianus TaxID=6549 RepID=UPI0022478DED|nr:uncharacterized protein LOC127717469 [Mytilus californianus]
MNLISCILKLLVICVLPLRGLPSTSSKIKVRGTDIKNRQKGLLDIQYAPVVKIRNKVTKKGLELICNPRGNPDNYTFADWEHWSEFNEHIRNVQGTSDGKLTFLISNNNNSLHENDGIYKCKTTNGINGANGRLYQKGSVRITNKAPPIFVNANKPIQYGRYGQKIKLKVQLYNKYGTIQTTISKLNEPLNIHGRQERILTHDMFHGVDVTVSGIKITFRLTLAKIEDFTDYTIKACNNITCNVFTVKVTSNCRPEPPPYVSVIPYARYLEVVWDPGFDGGYLQTFFVEYQQESENIWQRSGPVVDNRQVKMLTFINELNPKTRYHIRVLSKNEIGDSNQTAVTSVMTLEPTINIYRVKAVFVVLLIVIVVVLSKEVSLVVLLVLAVILAVYGLITFFFLRRKEKDASDNYNPREEEVRENFQVEPVDNQLYISSEDLDLARVHSLRNESEMDTTLPSTSHDNQIYQMQLHNEGGANGRRSCTYINRGMVSSVYNPQTCDPSLNYSEITFNTASTMQDAVIHGGVNRTIYSEIDLTAEPVAPLSSSESENDESDESDI